MSNTVSALKEILNVNERSLRMCRQFARQSAEDLILRRQGDGQEFNVFTPETFSFGCEIYEYVGILSVFLERITHDGKVHLYRTEELSNDETLNIAGEWTTDERNRWNNVIELQDLFDVIDVDCLILLAKSDHCWRKIDG